MTNEMVTSKETEDVAPTHSDYRKGATAGIAYTSLTQLSDDEVFTWDADLSAEQS